MGIGRFAFTPLLPMMMADGLVNLNEASWLASANYIGYLAGALFCTFQPWLAPRLGWRRPLNGPAIVRAGLAATALLTLGMALPAPAAWALLRFLAGVVSAFVFIYTSTWCLGQLARLNVPAMGALIYVGPGLGIMLGGLAATGMVSAGWSSQAGWTMFGLLAAVLTAAIWRVLRSDESPAAVGAAAGGAAPVAPVAPGQTTLLAIAYGLAGLGYIITATFLPVIARHTLPGSIWLDLFWPIFGAGVVVGAVVASRVPAAGDLRVSLAVCYAIQAAGVGAGLLSPTLAGFAIGSVLLGLPFTAITFFAMQEIRRLYGTRASSYIGLVTAMYGIGQIAGPPLAAALVARSGDAARGFNAALTIAAASLVLGSLLYLLLARLHPASAARAR